jgi:hypothetical protein
MTIPYRPLAIGIAAIAFSLILFERAQAGGSHFFAPVTDPLVKEECGGCHLPFAPSMLPASSWRRMMGDLSHHFGDDASIDAQTARKITDYLVANAADTGGQRFSGKLLRGVSTDNAQLRITELPKWVREHRKVSVAEWQHKDVRTKANCTACHVDAAKGYYDE